MSDHIKIVECPRDAMQGWSHFIATADKVRYIQSLLDIGFDTVDFGSFVSPKVIPQMRDTREVLDALDLTGTASDLLAIIANLRGAEDAAIHHQIDYLGYPFSVSETFQLRNANSTIAASVSNLQKIKAVCTGAKKKLVVYISMAFGNPYGDAWSPEIVFDWVKRITELDVDIISLADTVGIATPSQVFDITNHLKEHLPNQEIGVHLHSAPDNWQQKLQAALDAGCRRFDGAIRGIGGCPMADDVLVGNMNTENMIGYFNDHGYSHNINVPALAKAGDLAAKIFI
jgi:hydroxymethylglutaryl-CoA lyase